METYEDMTDENNATTGQPESYITLLQDRTGSVKYLTFTLDGLNMFECKKKKRWETATRH